MKRVYLYISTLLFAVSCTSEIPFEYNTIDPLYVIQAEFSLSDDFSTAIAQISTTSDLDSTDAEVVVTDADVSITTPQGDLIHLLFSESSSLYVASNVPVSTTPQQGDYTLDVRIGDDYYSSSCSLMSPAVIGSTTFTYQEVMMGMGVLMMKTNIEDPAGEDNYYRYIFTLPDGTTYHNEVVSDSGLDGYNIELYTQFNPDESLGYYTMSDDMAGSLYKISPGDIITITVEQIDKRPYDYLSTLGSSSSNPICSFEGGCLGYFSVSTKETEEILFTADAVIEIF